MDTGFETLHNFLMNKIIPALFFLLTTQSFAAFAISGTTTSVTFVRNDYSSVNVTTSAYLTLVASMPASATDLNIFDSSGQTLKIAVGATCASLLDQFIVPPGGRGDVSIFIPNGYCVAIKAVSGTANSGEIDVSFFN